MNNNSQNKNVKNISLYEMDDSSIHIFNKPYIDLGYSRYLIEKVFEEEIEKQNISKIYFFVISTKYKYFEKQGTNYRYFTDTSLDDVFTAIQAIILFFNKVNYLGIETTFVFPELGNQKIDFVPSKKELSEKNNFHGDKHINFFKSEREKKNPFIFKSPEDSQIVRSHEIILSIKRMINQILIDSGKKNIRLFFELPVIDSYSPVDMFNIICFTLTYFISESVLLNKRISFAFCDKKNDLTTVLSL